MKREEAKQMFRDDKDSYGKPRGIMGKLDKIYDDFEKTDLTESCSKKLANLRNQFGAVYTHFQLLKDMEKTKVRDPIAYEALKEPLQKIFDKNEKIAMESMDTIKEILDSFG